ncbi:hypothetical protein K435DRAFT_867556 [Dendrothele bispora CBS 962.96]|uniref:Uncharacterized protein n=1 Tax=Dendrothele bispora (strain CBS 962.96) TaxID=1314807 RepID=A0A4S8LDY4_DENBC|nr:hypothetical protein K435DRAFT_867556 [Dendrothele bispora CBS 962.96]
MSPALPGTSCHARILLTSRVKNFNNSQEQWIRYHFFHQFVPLNKANGLKMQDGLPARTLKDAEKMFKRAKQEQFAQKFADDRPEGWDKLLSEKWKNMKKQHQSTIVGTTSEPEFPDMAALFAVGDERIYARRLHQQDYNKRNQGKKASELNSGAKQEWDVMSIGEQSRWQAEAEVLRKQKQNEGLAQGSLYQSQQEALPRLQVLLRSLIGHSRGQMGHAQFFCMAAYYGEGDMLQTTFLEAGPESFEEHLTAGDLTQLQEHWRDFAECKLERNLPKLHETKLARSKEGKQYILPPWDEESSFKTYRKDFERFLEASWLLMWPASPETPGIPFSQVLESPQKFFRDGLLKDVKVKVDDLGQIAGSSLDDLSKVIVRFQAIHPEISVFKEKDELAAALAQPLSNSEEVDDLTDLNNPDVEAAPESSSSHIVHSVTMMTSQVITPSKSSHKAAVVPPSLSQTSSSPMFQSPSREKRVVLPQSPLQPNIVITTSDSSHTDLVVSPPPPQPSSSPVSRAKSIGLPQSPLQPNAVIITPKPKSSHTNVSPSLPQPSSSPMNQPPSREESAVFPQSSLQPNAVQPTLSTVGSTPPTDVIELRTNETVSGLGPVVASSSPQNAAKESPPHFDRNNEATLMTDPQVDVAKNRKGRGGGRGGKQRGRGRGARGARAARNQDIQVPSAEEGTVLAEGSGGSTVGGNKRAHSAVLEESRGSHEEAGEEGRRVPKKAWIDAMSTSGDDPAVRQSSRAHVKHDRSAENNIGHSPAHRRKKPQK